eukprot:Phypoly_transcript_20200.p1 GENE.Phypoly_transcript_20200~~Phypoly_transcript_20200.p1  ORF type:complete len:175 (+),score=12.54 Phypoly_transcript_20200:67-591(+)
MPVLNLNSTIVCLPSGITHLHFGSYFYQPVDFLPAKLTHLSFGKNFNQTINHLPYGLTHLTFHSFLAIFNQPVDHFPITYIFFGLNFNQKVDLPPFITHLRFGPDFNQPIEFLPPHLTRITFSTKASFSHSMAKIPNSVTFFVDSKSDEFLAELHIHTHVEVKTDGKFWLGFDS